MSCSVILMMCFPLNNSTFGDVVSHLSHWAWYTTDAGRSVKYIDHDFNSKDRLRTKRYDKRDDFNFHIVSFTFICNNDPAEEYVAQLIQYSRGCDSYHDFLDRWLLLTRKLLNQELVLGRLKSSLRRFYGNHIDLGSHYKRPWICSVCRNNNPIIS